MILSKKHKFIFIKGKKVAGTSIEVLLSYVCGPDDIITPITPIDERRRLTKGINAAQNYGVDKEANIKYLATLKNSFTEQIGSIETPKEVYYNHMPLSEVINLYKDISDDWIIFAVERCPYRKIISLANTELNFKEYRQNGKPMVSDVKTLKNHLEKIMDNGSIINVKNIDLYKNSAGNICTEILHFDRLEKDISKLMSRLNITDYPKLEHYKKGVSSESLDLSSLFSKRQIALINELFEDEFNSFGYEMIK